MSFYIHFFFHMYFNSSLSGSLKKKFHFWALEVPFLGFELNVEISLGKNCHQYWVFIHLWALWNLAGPASQLQVGATRVSPSLQFFYALMYSFPLKCLAHIFDLFLVIIDFFSFFCHCYKWDLFFFKSFYFVLFYLIFVRVEESFWISCIDLVVSGRLPNYCVSSKRFLVK